MADIPQEVREAAAEFYAKRRGGPIAAKIKAGLADDNDIVQALHAMFLAGKRAGMERAAVWLREQDGCGEWAEAAELFEQEFAIAQAIRSENDGHG